MAYDYDLTDVKGIGPVTAEKLRSAGITSVEMLAVTPVRTLVEIAGLGEDKALELVKAARSLIQIKFMKASELLEKRKQVGFLTTGCKALDDLLMGGIETQAITELVGEYGVGKTQLCHQLCVTVQLPKEKGGLGGLALFIDTEGTFRPERIVQIADRFGLNSKHALDNIIYARAYNSDHQVLIVEEAVDMIKENNIKLIVIDSLISHFRGEYLGRETLAMRQQRMNKHIHHLLRLADIYNLAIVVTNQVLANPESFFGNPQKPAGGNILAHGLTYRIWLRKGKDNKRIARIFDSPKHPESEAVFQVTEKGIVDAED
ncbi:MAG: DNA repair and recombination protein RadA [Candidatus Nezhaarchaeota archaeon]|nr:DNA repair and recombination protein RadA [Candidatus Nezhaarchaeota archaeon]MCX8142570.1 DNA repair and recombination protein RadA [Candidatus Nezhaarchaeota archaeon]